MCRSLDTGNLSFRDVSNVNEPEAWTCKDAAWDEDIVWHGVGAQRIYDSGWDDVTWRKWSDEKRRAK